MNEDRVSVWEYINPVSLAGEYTKPFVLPTTAAIYGTYSSMSAGKFLFPGLLPTHGVVGLSHLSKGAQALSRGAWHMAAGNWATTSTGQKFAKVARTMMFGQQWGMSGDAMMVAQHGLGASRRQLGSQIVDIMADTRGPTLHNIKMRGTLGMLKSRASNLGSARILGQAALINMSRVISPVLNLYLGYQLVSYATEQAFKGIQTVTNVMERATENMARLELGGELSRGFLTTQAATERQRALQAIQASHLSGRRFLGSEAQLAH